MKYQSQKKGFFIAAILFLMICLGIGTAQLQAATGFHISGRNLLDANGNNFIIRGISHAHCWYTSQTSAFANIKGTGANTVRVVLSGGRWTANSASDVANVISLCKTNRLIAVLEDHDTTGYGEQSGAYTLAQAVSYWTSIQSALTGQEAYVIINIGNEPYGNTNPSDWVAATKNAIIAMRNAGFQHTLMIDATNWGQDWQFISRDNAASVLDSDTLGNTIFSVHMYGVYDTAAEIQSYVSYFVTNGLPLVIGEFGYNHSDGNPDEATIMSQAVSNGIGYMGWSWCGNSSEVAYLDMVTNWDPASLTEWGQIIINGANGIDATSQECSVFGGPTTSTTSTTSASTTTTAASTTTTTGTTTTTTSGGSCDCGTCSWYGTNVPMCCQSCSGWGWQDGGCNRSCVCPGSCPGGSTTTAASTTTTAASTTTTAASTTTTTAASTSTSTTSASTSTTTTAASTTTTAASTTTTTTAAAGCTCDSGCDGTAITPDFTKDGAGQFCWQATSGTYINSWNTNKVEVNDTVYTNLYVLTSSFPAKINGVWYIYYDSSVAWGHFELKN